MEPVTHSINSLFRQLGLPDSDKDVEGFIQQHRPLPSSVCLQEATFWSPAQASFLREAIEDDADWAEIVDELDVRLHAEPHRAVPGKAWLSKQTCEYLPELCGY